MYQFSVGVVLAVSRSFVYYNNYSGRKETITVEDIVSFPYNSKISFLMFKLVLGILKSINTVKYTMFKIHRNYHYIIGSQI